MSPRNRAAGALLPRRRLLEACAAGMLGGCRRRPGGRPGRLVFKHQPLWGDPEPFRDLLARFTKDHPECELVTEALPSSSDLAHQYFLTALEGGAGDFDVFVMDVVWVAELARAGWLVDLSNTHPPARLGEEFLSGAAPAINLLSPEALALRDTPPDSTLGIRPERLRVVGAGAGALDAPVWVVEPTGPETWVTVDLAGARARGRAPPNVSFKPGEMVGLSYDTADLHFFDKTSGLRLVR